MLSLKPIKSTRRLALSAALLCGATSALTLSALGVVQASQSATAANTGAANTRAAQPRAHAAKKKVLVVHTAGANEVTETTAAIHGSVDGHGSEAFYYFQYGLTTAYEATTTEMSAGAANSPVKVSAELSELTPGTVYHFRAVGKRATSEPVFGVDHTFTTLLAGAKKVGGGSSSKVRAPSVTTGGARPISYSTATLSATINPHGLATSYYFQYGTTASFGSQTPTESAGAGTVPVKVSQSVAGLTLATTYHFRVVATSSASATPVYGQPHVFTTSRLRLRLEFPTKPTAVYGRPFTLNGTLTGTGSAGQAFVLQADPFPYTGTFTQLGEPVVTSSTGGFSIHVPGLRTNTLVRLASTTVPPSYSPSVTVRVAARVTLHVRTTRHRGYLLFAGSVEPAKVGQTLLLQLLKPGVLIPVTVGKATVKRGSHFAVVLAISRPGRYRAALNLPSTGAQSSSVSGLVRIRQAAI